MTSSHTEVNENFFGKKKMFMTGIAQNLEKFQVFTFKMKDTDHVFFLLFFFCFLSKCDFFFIFFFIISLLPLKFERLNILIINKNQDGNFNKKYRKNFSTMISFQVSFFFYVSCVWMLSVFIILFFFFLILKI